MDAGSRGHPGASGIGPPRGAGHEGGGPPGHRPVRRTGRLRRKDRLRSRRDFQRVGREGRRRRSRHFVLLIAPKRPEVERDAPALGVTVSRKVGKAVRRNRVKRCIREWFRHERGAVPPRSDVVVIARPGAAELPTAEIHRELSSLLR